MNSFGHLVAALLVPHHHDYSKYAKPHTIVNTETLASIYAVKHDCTSAVLQAVVDWNV